jgi:hypothetical protein
MKTAARHNTTQHLHSKDNERFKAIICLCFTAANRKLAYFVVHMYLLQWKWITKGYTGPICVNNVCHSY